MKTDIEEFVERNNLQDESLEIVYEITFSFFLVTRVRVCAKDVMEAIKKAVDLSHLPIEHISRVSMICNNVFIGKL